MYPRVSQCMRKKWIVCRTVMMVCRVSGVVSPLGVFVIYIHNFMYRGLNGSVCVRVQLCLDVIVY